MTAALRVLVVEDDPVQALMLTLMLAHLGISAQVAADGAQAVEAVRASRFDLVLMDCVMPVLNGVEATRRIRLFEAACGRDAVRIVAVTASGMADECRRYLEVGMDEVVLKPVSTVILAGVLAAHAAHATRASSFASAPRPYPSLGAMT